MSQKLNLPASHRTSTNCSTCVYIYITMATNGIEGARAGPYKLVTVNTAPDRAKIIVGRICEEIKGQYLIDYVANSTSEPSFLPGPSPMFGRSSVVNDGFGLRKERS